MSKVGTIKEQVSYKNLSFKQELYSPEGG